ncbi:MAG: hypothetical protein QOF58_7205 [Pseudonocardiales bacterium]|nr:hypothetical protein [Pseudonocardiales bacterium]
MISLPQRQITCVCERRLTGGHPRQHAVQQPPSLIHHEASFAHGTDSSGWGVLDFLRR